MDGHTILALNYDQSEVEGSPEVIWIDTECLDFSSISPTFAEYTDDLIHVDEHPCFEVSQLSRHKLLTESSFTFEYPDGFTEVVEQKLFDTDKSILLYVRQSFPEGEEHSLCEITKPLDPDQATIEAYRTSPIQTWHLTLAPVDHDDFEQAEDQIHWLHAYKTSRGWKNAESSGVPICATYELKDKQALKELRKNLLGGEPGERALAEEQWQEKMDGMSDEDMEGLFPHMMMQMIENSEQMVKDLDLGDPPPEIKDAFEHLSQLKEKLVHDIRERGVNAPAVPPELVDLMKQLLMDQDKET